MPGNDVNWFAYLCVENGVADPDLCRQIAHALGDNLDMLVFAETLIANDVCTDKQLLQDYINQAWQNSQTGQPPPKQVLMSGPPPAPTGNPPQQKLKPLTTESKASVLVADFDEDTTELGDRPMIHSDVERSLSIRPENESAKPKRMHLPPPDGAQAAAPKAPPAPPAAPQAPAAQEDPTVDVSPKTGKRVPSTEGFSVGIDPSNVEGRSVDFAQVAGMSDDDLRTVMVKLLLGCQEMGASDLHISADARPFVRHCRELRYISDYTLSAEDSLKLNCALLSPDQKEYFLEKQDYDFALALDEANRYRVNLMMQKDGAAGTYRIIPNQIQSLEQLGFANADVIRKLLSFHNGLILVTGPVGSGKTTTMASLVAELNQQREDHIICVENPVEIVHESMGCNVTQREVGTHTLSFHAALKGALREDPDIIVIGELRDLETIEMAITASETGHLVIGTLHTADAATTLNRLLDVFPPSQQPQIRAMVAGSLRGIICQRLLPAVDGGLIVACELLLNNLAVGNLVREGKAHALRAVLETGSKQGMCMMDNYIMSLWQQGRISQDTALAYIHDRAVRNRISSQQQLGNAGAQAVQTSLPGQKDSKKKWGLFN